MKIIIIGAGMGGMTAGLALKRFGHQVQAYEAVRFIRPVGAALSLWPNGIKCLDYLGLHDQVARLGGDMSWMAYADAHTGKYLSQFSLDPLVQEVGERPYPVARAELQDMLIEEFGRQDVHLGKRLVKVVDDGHHVTAHFEDGTSATGDMLVGADGTHSTVRDYVLEQPTERRYAGYVNWNGLVDIDESIAPANQWTTFVGEGKRVSLMPVANHRFYFFFDVPLPKGLEQDRSTLREDLRGYFAGWADPVQRLIEKLDPATTNRVEIHDIEPFMKLARGRVVLVGDAGHSTTPDIGQGGCAAMEDSVVLATTLQTHSLGIEDALHRYQERRNWRVADLVLKARKRCDVTHGKDMAVTKAWYEELHHESGEHIMKGMANNILQGPLG